MDAKEKMIKKEKMRLLQLFNGIPEDSRKLVEGLVENAAFLRIILADMQSEISAEGTVDNYQNGNSQSGKKISAVTQAYNTSLKNYTTIISRLEKMLPKQEAVVRDSPLVKALQRYGG